MVTQSTPKTGIDHKKSSRKRKYPKIIRAQALQPKCTSLPSLEPYRDSIHLPLRRATCFPTSQRCSSCVPSWSNSIRRATREPPLSHSKCQDATVVSNLSPSSSASSVAQENYTITTRPPSSNGIAYEVVFNASSIRQYYTPQPQLFNSYSSVKDSEKSATTAEEFDFDDWNTNDELYLFKDSDESKNEEEAENIDDQKESEQKASVALPAPQCKYGVFFTAAKPPLPPSALERIRRYHN